MVVAALMPDKGHAMLLDCRSEEPHAVPLSDSNLVVVVTNSHVKHKLAGSQVRDHFPASCFELFSDHVVKMLE